ncbi:MAG: Polyketide cyclase / dehydrase and lipid transport [Frankiales bacterium]|nr:Polyketide cyclase / dehydrase and lipid transport [Frankiales bacterium]
MQSLEVVHDSPLAADRVLAFLAHHENLGPLLGATVTRVRDGRTEPDGAGSVRAIRVWPLPAFEEEVVATTPTTLDYRISKGSPLRGHSGRVEVVQRGAGSRVTWSIRFDSAVPGLAPVVKVALQQSLRRGLPKLDRLA